METQKQNILVIGGGGREHAICWTLKKSKRVGKIYCIPGNAGIFDIAECHPDIAATDLTKIVDFVAAHPDIYMTVVAPDDPLALGLVDILQSKGFRTFGPSKLAAELEASKVFSKDFMKRNKIPSAEYEVFSDYKKADKYLTSAKYPLVIKADGLALGKGVAICNDVASAKSSLVEMMLDKKFGKACDKVVIEEFLTGFEVSVLAFCDGRTVVPMVSSQDHKRALDNDMGLNTGGMGTFSPSLTYTDEMENTAFDTIFIPTIEGLKNEGREFKGVIYFGLMVESADNIKVLEYNARFGDPEAQVVLPRLENDLLDIFDACIDQKLCEIAFAWKECACVCVVAASGGYPLDIEKGKEIAIGKLDDDMIVFHAGTAIKDGKLVTNGGRVLGLTSLGASIDEAREKVYKNIKNISFDGMHYRTDIGKKK